MSYEELRNKYRITRDDHLKMGELRRKWAFDDVMAEIEHSRSGEPEPTDEQIETIIDEYLDLRVYKRGDWELEQESEDMAEAFDKVMEEAACS